MENNNVNNVNPLPETFIANWSNESIVRQLHYQQLGQTDMQVSELSLGAAHVGRDICFSEDGTQIISGYEDVVNSIRTTIKCGINFIDTSPFYGCGKAELVLGKALEDVPRKAYYIATKVGRKADCTFDYSGEWAVKSVESSLQKLGLQYLDVIHVHDVEYAPNIDIIINETLPALDKLRQMKKVRYIGITGYPLHTLKEIVEKSKIKLDLVLSYCRCTPFDQTLHQFIPFFKQKGLGIINAAVLGMGLLTNRGTAYWHAAHQSLKDICSSAALHCKNKGVDISKICVYYALQQNDINTHLIGMEDLNALYNNLEVLINGIEEFELQTLNEIIEQFFSKTTARNWEGVEVKRYRTDPIEFAKFLRGEI